MLRVAELFASLGNVFGLQLLSGFAFAYLLVVKLYLQTLELYLLLQEIELAVIAHILLLFAIFVDFRRAVFYLALQLLSLTFQLRHLIFIFLYAGLIHCNFVFQVLHLVGKFAAKHFYAVHLRKDGLEQIEILKTIFNRTLFLFYFLVVCHFYSFRRVFLQG